MKFLEKLVAATCRQDSLLSLGLDPEPNRLPAALHEVSNEADNCGLVVGATYPEELRAIHSLCSDMPTLVPGAGSQGGDLEASTSARVNEYGERPIIAVSRAILYAGDGSNYAAVAEHEAQLLRDRINEARGKI